jgi:regulator of replication initiation timing
VKTLDLRKTQEELLAFDELLTNAKERLAQIHKEIDEIAHENAELQSENARLRQRLAEVEQKQQPTSTTLVQNKEAAKNSLLALYENGFHICTPMYGERLLPDEECLYCLEILER